MTKSKTPITYSVSVQTDPLSEPLSTTYVVGRHWRVLYAWDEYIRSYRVYPEIVDGVARLEFIDCLGSKCIFTCDNKYVVAFYDVTPYETYIRCHLCQYPFYKMKHHIFREGTWIPSPSLRFNEQNSVFSLYSELCRIYGYYGHGEQEI